MIVVIRPNTDNTIIATNPSSVSSFSDVLITNLQEDEVLTYSDGKWRNSPAVAASDSNLVFNQGVASSTWVINHDLSKFPVVTVIDSAGDEVDGDITYTNNQSLILSFSASFAGKAYLN